MFLFWRNILQLSEQAPSVLRMCSQLHHGIATLPGNGLNDMIDWQSERRSRDRGEEKWQKQ
jgi:hypothetical protein